MTRDKLAKAVNAPFGRRGFMMGGAAVGALGVAGLPMRSAQAAKKGGHMRMGKAHGSTTDTLDPGVAENGFTSALLFGIHGYMTEVGVDGSLQPCLAESWEAAPDAMTWTFNLRKGVTYHDGKPFGAADVIAAINHHRGEKSTSAAKPLVEAITDIKAEGDHRDPVGGAHIADRLEQIETGLFRIQPGALQCHAGDRAEHSSPEKEDQHEDDGRQQGDED